MVKGKGKSVLDSSITYGIDIDIRKSLDGPIGKMDLEVAFQIEAGNLISIYGPSGAGKTSVLRIIAGLLAPDSGTVRCGPTSWVDTNHHVNLPPQKRNVGYVFQDYALFPNMTVIQHLQYALPKGDDHSIITELIDMTELEDLKDRKPATLSGGQRQRVALARSLVQRPKVLLLDEPLSALDPSMRFKLQNYILDLHKKYNLTTILVSHDLTDVFRMSDELMIVENGSIIMQGKPTDVFSHKEVGGKFQFVGEVVNIEIQDFLFIVSILIGKDLVRVIADEEVGRDLQLGDKVIVASKAFNPIIRKLS